MKIKHENKKKYLHTNYFTFIPLINQVKRIEVKMII